ncbi:hypothetical protein MJO29_003224 [Puccinia striiformis f. sp. tritici]|nr:hypothetical protein MJO29_003224 [Puccinia striiformis f. sp. tritici]
MAPTHSLPPIPPKNPGSATPMDVETNEANVSDLPPRPTTRPPPSVFFAHMDQILTDPARRAQPGYLAIDDASLQLILRLMAEEVAGAQQLQEMFSSLSTEKSASSYAARVAATVPVAPQKAPPPKHLLDAFKPGKVIIHVASEASALEKIDKKILIGKANDALKALDAVVQDKPVTIKALEVLKSGDVCFYAKNRAHQSWLAEHKHLWSKKVHVDLTSTPATTSVFVHNLHVNVDISDPLVISRIGIANGFVDADFLRARWIKDHGLSVMSSNVGSKRNPMPSVNTPAPLHTQQTQSMNVDLSSTHSLLSTPHTPHLPTIFGDPEPLTLSEESAILQLNCHVDKAVTLQLLNDPLPYSFLVLQEPWVDKDTLSPPVHRDWHLFVGFEHVPTNFNEWHKACIYVRRSYSSADITHLAGGDQLLVAVDSNLNPAKPIRIINLYNPPPKFTGLEPFFEWLTKVNCRQISTIILMDANLHHRQWNPPKMRSHHSQADQLIGACGKAGFRLASPPHVPTYYSRKGNGLTIDLAWTNFLASKMVERAIKVVINVGRRDPPMRWAKPRWEEIFVKDAELSLKTQLSDFDRKLNDCPVAAVDHADKLIDILKDHQETLGRSVRDVKSKAKSWWCKTTMDPIIKTRSRARRWMLLAKSDEASQCYADWNRYCREMITHLKRASWRQFLEHPSEADVFKAFKSTKMRGSNSVIPLRDLDGVLQVNKDKQSELLFYGTSVVDAPIDLSDIEDSSAGSQARILFPKIIGEEVACALDRIAPKKAPGIDGIHNEYLKVMKISLVSKHQSLKFALTLEIKAPPGKYPNAVQESLSRPMLKAYLGHIPESLKLTHRITPLTPNTPLNFMNLKLEKKKAIESTRALITANEGLKENIFIYTDGSYDERAGGAAAAVAPSRSIVYTAALGKDRLISNHECEVYGLLLAVQILMQRTPKKVKNVYILIDNQGTILRMKDVAQTKPGQYLFNFILDSLNSLTRKLTVTLVWCPGHSDIAGNEEADEMAKAAAARNEEANISLFSNIKKTQRTVIREHLPSLFPISHPSPLHIALNAIINQLSTGQIALNYHLFRMKKIFDPSCPKCKHKETPKHFFDFCPAYKTERITLRRELKRKKINFRSNDLHGLLQKPHAHALLSKFIQATGWFPYTSAIKIT